MHESYDFFDSEVPPVEKPPNQITTQDRCSRKDARNGYIITQVEVEPPQPVYEFEYKHTDEKADES